MGERVTFAWFFLDAFPFFCVYMLLGNHETPSSENLREVPFLPFVTDPVALS